MKVTPVPTKENLTYLRKGGDIGVYTVGPSEISIRNIDGDQGTYVVTIHEGKNRQVRNMFEYFGCEIKTLKRIGIGELSLKGLRLGKSRELTDEELHYVMELVGLRKKK